MRRLYMGEQKIAGQRVDYYLLADGGDQGEHYGVQIEAETGEESQICALTSSGKRILELVALLIRNTVTPLALSDVVEDWL